MAIGLAPAQTVLLVTAFALGGIGVLLWIPDNAASWRSTQSLYTRADCVCAGHIPHKAPMSQQLTAFSPPVNNPASVESLAALLPHLLNNSQIHEELATLAYDILVGLEDVGKLPKKQPATAMAYQTMELFWETIVTKKVAVGPRCLEWTPIFYATKHLPRICTDSYELSHIGRYCEERGGNGSAGVFKTKQGGNGLCADIQNASTVAEGLTFNTIICTQVFEHVEKPWLAAAEVYKLLAPEGLLIFTVPFAYPLHPSGYSDYYRYSIFGAYSILDNAGFCVFFAQSGNDALYTALPVLGDKRRIPTEHASKSHSYFWPTNIMLLATKTDNCEQWRAKYGPLELPSLYWAH